MNRKESTHLTPDELAERVFPVEERAVAVPAHLASCTLCQERVGRLREAWLLDRGAVAGTVDAIPPELWEAQLLAVMRQVAEEKVAEASFQSTGVHAFPAGRPRSFLRHPLLAISSLAAALVLVTGITVLRLRTPQAAPTARVQPSPAAPVTVSPAKSDTADEELLRSIDGLLSDEGSYSSLVPEETL